MSFTIDESLIHEVSAKIAHHYRFLPLRQDGGVLEVLVRDPSDLEHLDGIGRELNRRVRGIEAGEQEIAEGLKRYYGIGAETLENLVGSRQDRSADNGTKAAGHDDLSDLAADASIVKFVNQIVLEAYMDRATDVHIEPFEGKLRVRYRIDGMLHEAIVPPSVRHFQDAITSRIKIMADMNIAERRVPQDGRIRLRVGHDDLDIRVSVLPVAHGESVNLRLLRRGSVFFSLEELGYRGEARSKLEHAMRRPHGIILVTGPTGSGKTTTLYACLSWLNQIHAKIITIEDPVEYEMEGICQMQVHPKVGFTFAAGLRSTLRHDPDVILVGEVRDFETAELAIRASLTGHLVFSTLHTNDAPGAISRLVDLGVEPFLVASSLECVIAQRLVRRVCDQCVQPAEVHDNIREQLGIERRVWDQVDFFQGTGCKQCRESGYRQRTAISETINIDEAIRDLLTERVSAGKIRRLAREKGMITLREDGWSRVVEGITTPEEVLRVTQGDAA